MNNIQKFFILVIAVSILLSLAGCQAAPQPTTPEPTTYSCKEEGTTGLTIKAVDQNGNPIKLLSYVSFAIECVSTEPVDSLIVPFLPENDNFMHQPWSAVSTEIGTCRHSLNETGYEYVRENSNSIIYKMICP